MKNADRRPLPVRIFRFYYDGFREMTLGRTLWAIILIKLFILFVVLRLLFFPDVLGGQERRRARRNRAQRTDKARIGNAKLKSVWFRKCYKAWSGRGRSSP